MKYLNIVLDRKELIVRIEAKSLRIDRADGSFQRLPLHMIRQVVVIGSPMVSCDVWRALADENISAVLLPARGSGSPAFLESGLSTSVLKRSHQYRAAADETRSISIARWLVHKKISGQMDLLITHEADHDGLSQLIKQMITGLENIESAKTIQQLMGIEGACAVAYFKGLATIIPEAWQFNGRNRRPPRDPVNALMSLSYTLIQGEIRQSVLIGGLDPALGFLHTPQPGRNSLALDILEPIRPFIDAFVLFIIQDILYPKDFIINEQDGCLLGKEGRQRFFKEWTSWCMESVNSDANIKAKIEEIIKAIDAMISPPDAIPE